MNKVIISDRKDNFHEIDDYDCKGANQFLLLDPEVICL